MNYIAVYGAENGWWSGVVCDFPGLLGGGETLEACRLNLRAGAEEWKQGIKIPLPPPYTTLEMAQAEYPDDDYIIEPLQDSTGIARQDA